MSKFFELGDSLINCENVSEVELTDNSVGVTYENGKYVIKSFTRTEDAEKAYSEIKFVLVGKPTSRSFAVSYFYDDDFSGKGIGLDVFEDVKGKITNATIIGFLKAIEEAHKLKNVSILGVIPLEVVR